MRRHSSGLFEQVSTGEGKTWIISSLAIIYGLMGEKIDIITISGVLAKRDAQSNKEIYDLFGFTASDNSENINSNYRCGMKDCYKSDIIYGDASQFQFDYLRDEFGGLQTLGNRKGTLLLVDEVDSVLIDECT